jgi:hypothetical protein
MEAVRVNFKNDASYLCNKDLATQDDGHDDEEHPVCEEALKNVLLVANLARWDHVNDLHQHEHSEDKRHMSRRAIFFILRVQGLTVSGVRPAWVHKLGFWAVVPQCNVRLNNEVLTGKHAHKQASAHPQGLAQNVLNHFPGHNVVITVLGWS